MRNGPAFHYICHCLCVGLLALTSCVAATSPGTLANAPVNEVTKGDSLFHLDLNKRSVVQPIAPQDEVDSGTKFVQIEVTTVTNPRRYALSFQVSYQPKNGDRIDLGSFGLYPADNPGKFIVATQGKLKSEGALVLSMILYDKPEPGEAVRVTVKKMTFRRK